MATIKSEGQNVKGAVAYLLGPVTGIVLLFSEKKNGYIRFHAMQSTVVFGSILLLHVVLWIIPILGWFLLLMLAPVLTLVTFILWLVLMYKAFTGEHYKLPYFGDLAERQLEKLGK